MAYPMHPLPTFAEFRDTLSSKYQIAYSQGCKVHDGTGNPEDVWFFRRTLGDGIVTYPFEPIDDNDLVSWHIVRGVCKHFEIDIEKDQLFGLTLG